MALNAFERETTICTSDGDDRVGIFTAQRKYITKLKKDDRFTLRAEGKDPDGTPWAEFTIAADQWNPVTGAKRRVRKLGEAEKERRRASAATARAQKQGEALQNVA